VGKRIARSIAILVEISKVMAEANSVRKREKPEEAPRPVAKRH
jgi:hypothetical protein